MRNPAFRAANDEHRKLCTHPEIQELGEIELRMLRGQPLPGDLDRHEEIKGRPPYLRLHINTMQGVVQEFRSHSDKFYDGMIAELESEIAECDSKISTFALDEFDAP